MRHTIYKQLSATWNFRWQDRQGSYTEYINLQPIGERPYPSYGLLDVKVDWSYRDIKLFGEINNVFNTSYYDLGNIEQPGCWGKLGVSYCIK